MEEDQEQKRIRKSSDHEEPERGENEKNSDFMEALKCSICKGFLIDATTLTECLHSFCRSCIVMHIEVGNWDCPICCEEIHHSRPKLSLRSDTVKQEIIFKLVPGLQESEISRRRDFLVERLETTNDAVIQKNLDHKFDRYDLIPAPKKISFCLKMIEEDSFKLRMDSEWVRIVGKHTISYLRTNVDIPVSCLQSFVRSKAGTGLTGNVQVMIIFRNEVLKPTDTLVKVDTSDPLTPFDEITLHFGVFQHKADKERDDAARKLKAEQEEKERKRKKKEEEKKRALAAAFEKPPATKRLKLDLDEAPPRKPAPKSALAELLEVKQEPKSPETASPPVSKSARRKNRPPTRICNSRTSALDRVLARVQPKPAACSSSSVDNDGDDDGQSSAAAIKRRSQSSDAAAGSSERVVAPIKLVMTQQPTNQSSEKQRRSYVIVPPDAEDKSAPPPPPPPTNPSPINISDVLLQQGSLKRLAEEASSCSSDQPAPQPQPKPAAVDPAIMNKPNRRKQKLMKPTHIAKAFSPAPMRSAPPQQNHKKQSNTTAGTSRVSNGQVSHRNALSANDSQARNFTVPERPATVQHYGVNGVPPQANRNKLTPHQLTANHNNNSANLISRSQQQFQQQHRQRAPDFQQLQFKMKHGLLEQRPRRPDKNEAQYEQMRLQRLQLRQREQQKRVQQISKQKQKQQQQQKQPHAAQQKPKPDYRKQSDEEIHQASLEMARKVLGPRPSGLQQRKNRHRPILPKPVGPKSNYAKMAAKLLKSPAEQARSAPQIIRGQQRAIAPSSSGGEASFNICQLMSQQINEHKAKLAKDQVVYKNGHTSATGMPSTSSFRALDGVKLVPPFRASGVVVESRPEQQAQRFRTQQIQNRKIAVATTSAAASTNASEEGSGITFQFPFHRRDKQMPFIRAPTQGSSDRSPKYLSVNEARMELLRQTRPKEIQWRPQKQQQQQSHQQEQQSSSSKFISLGAEPGKSGGAGNITVNKQRNGSISGGCIYPTHGVSNCLRLSGAPIGSIGQLRSSPVVGAPAASTDSANINLNLSGNAWTQQRPQQLASAQSAYFTVIDKPHSQQQQQTDLPLDFSTKRNRS